jgi:hypothetical protein
MATTHPPNERRVAEGYRSLWVVTGLPMLRTGRARPFGSCGFRPSRARRGYRGVGFRSNEAEQMRV